MADCDVKRITGSYFFSDDRWPIGAQWIVGSIFTPADFIKNKKIQKSDPIKIPQVL